MEQIEVQYAQIEILPFIEKYNLPVWFVIVLISFVALKQLGLIYFVKDMWAWLVNFMNQKTKLILELRGEIEALKSRVRELEIENQKIHIENASIKASIAPLIHYLKTQGVDNLGLEKFLETWKRED